MFGAFVEGWRRVLRAPALALWVLVALLLVSVPLAINPGDMVGDGVLSAGRSALSVTAGAWSAEAPTQPLSPAAALFQALLGFGRTLAAPYLLFWLFLSGGLLDRFARGRRVGAAHFFAVSGVFLFRFVRLGLGVAATYYVLFRMFRPGVSSRTETLAFLAGIALVNLVADFAKVRAVVEDRRSMLSALLASMRFLRTHPIAALGLFVLHTVLAAAILVFWPRLMPLPPGPWEALGLGVLFLLIMILARLAFMASEVALFQRKLAHASYAAMPDPVWPESPAVEAIQNFTARAQHAPRLQTEEGYENRDASTW